MDGHDQYTVGDCHRTLGKICRSRGETRKAIIHFKTALRIVSSFNCDHFLFWANFDLADLFFGERRFNDAHARIKRAKLHVTNDPLLLGRAMKLQAEFWYKEGRFEEATSEVLRAVDVFEKLGAAMDLEVSRILLQDIDEAMNEPDLNSELLETAPLPTPINSPFAARGTAEHHLANPSRRTFTQTADPESRQRPKGKREQRR